MAPSTDRSRSESIAGVSIVKRFFLFLVFLVAVLIGAVLIVPGFIDWTVYRDRIAAEIEAVTGRQVTLGGDIRLQLVPKPTLQLGDVRIASTPGTTTEPLVTLSELEVRVFLTPLLQGRVEFERIRMVEPLVTLEVSVDGQGNWDDRRAAAAPEGGDDGLDATRLADAVVLRELQIVGGTVVYRDARAGSDRRLDDLHMTVAADSLFGPVEVVGHAILDDIPIHAEVSVGRYEPGSDLPLRLSLDFLEAATDADFVGMVALPGVAAVPRVQGEIAVRGTDLSRPIALVERLGAAPVAPDLLPALAVPFSARAGVTLDSGRIEALDLEVQVRETVATGAATVLVGDRTSMDVVLSLSSIDLDRWVAALPAPPAPPPTDDIADAAADPAAVLASLVESLPADLSMQLDLGFDALTFNGGIVRQGRFEAELANGAITIDRLAALAPGGAAIAVSATVAPDVGAPFISAALDVNADNLRGALDWLDVDTTAIPADRLRKFSLLAQVQGRPDDFQIGGIDLRLDTTRMVGGLAFVDRGRPGVGVRLEIDRLNLDAYRPPAQADGPQSDSGMGGEDVWARFGAYLNRVDANVDARVGSITVAGIPVSGVAVDATLNRGALTLRSARIDDLAGIGTTLQGRVTDLTDLAGLDVQMIAQTASLALVQRAFGWQPTALVERLGGLSVNGRLTGDRSALAVEVGVAVGGGTIDAGGRIDAPLTSPVVDLKVRATYPGLVPLIQILEPSYQTRFGDPGPVDLYAEVLATAAGVGLSGIQGTVGGVSVRGEAGFETGGARPMVTVAVQTAGNLAIDRFQPTAETYRPAFRTGPQDQAWSDEPIDIGWLLAVDGDVSLTAASLEYAGHRLEDSALRARLREGVLTLDQADGRFLGGRLGVSGRLAAHGNGVTSTLALTVVDARIRQALFAAGVGSRAFNILQGTLDLTLDLSSTGASQATLVSALDGTGRLVVEDGIVRGFAMARVLDRLEQLSRPDAIVALVRQALQSGTTEFRLLETDFTIDDGVASIARLTLDSRAGVAEATGQVDLPNQRLDARAQFRLNHDGALPPVGMRIHGPLSNPTRTLDAGELQSYLIQRAVDQVRRVVPDVPSVLPGAASDVLEGLLDGFR